ncbi:MAG: HNH endonuclease [Phenylobacterium sp.]|uniref:HNH endonuclease n=1 Tax=Phenylobacterium sp. TaxID=1871053 RepID=UPI0025E5FCC8|nr:HNH endonuclease signature motif containing protein [Phenylobacterium sp.]MCA6256950.1 HNH endonuclease [Phenylobacterium sp.]
MTPDEKRQTLARLREAIGQIRPEKTPRRGFTARQRQAVAEAFDGQCSACESGLTGTWHIDHVIPLALGGRHDPGNWVPVCVDCHKAKTRGDVKAIAKTARIIRRETEGPKPSRLKSRGFNRGMRKKMDGTVEKRLPTANNRLV